MNYTSAIFLVNDSVRAISVSYELEPDGKTGKGPFVLFKSMDADLRPGDYVVVPTDTRHKLTVVRVEEVDKEVDLDSSHQFEWIVGPVSTFSYKAILASEVRAIDTIKSAEKKARQDELKAKLLADNPAIQALSELEEPGHPALEPPRVPEV